MRSWSILAAILMMVAAQAAQSACGTALKPGVTKLIIQSGDTERKIFLYVPQGYKPEHQHALVLDLHGTTQSPFAQMRLSGSQALADREGFLVGALSGIDLYWNVPPKPDEPSEVQYVQDAIDAIGEAACLDSKRVYAMGYSGGARVSSEVACKIPNRIAAISAVAGIRFPGQCAGKTPILSFHGTKDSYNQYEGDPTRPKRWGPSVEDAVRSWVKLNGGSDVAEERMSKTLVRVSCKDCEAPVVLYRVEGGGHSWPGSENDIEIGWMTTEISATELSWEFFKAHSLGRP